MLNTIADTYHGRFNPYLITSKQLQDQLSIISSHVPSELSLPIDNLHTDIAKVFKLIKSKARMITEYLIFELRIPLITRDTFEIFKIIPIPVQKQGTMISITPISNFLAINLKKDLYISMSHSGIRSCLVSDASLYLCHISKPMHKISNKMDFCETRETACETIIKTCKNIWLESNFLNNYIYFCCNQCQVRSMCGDQVAVHHLTHAGIISLDNGCIIKTDEMEIIAHDSLSSEMYIRPNVYAPVIASINHIINVSIPSEISELSETKAIQKNLQDIERKIKIVQENESISTSISYHDVHHYAVIYVCIGLGVLGVAVYWARRGRGSWCKRAPAAAAPVIYERINESVSARVNKATSPLVSRIEFK